MLSRGPFQPQAACASVRTLAPTSRRPRSPAVGPRSQGRAVPPGCPQTTRTHLHLPLPALLPLTAPVPAACRGASSSTSSCCCTGHGCGFGAPPTPLFVRGGGGRGSSPGRRPGPPASGTCWPVFPQNRLETQSLRCDKPGAASPRRRE